MVHAQRRSAVHGLRCASLVKNSCWCYNQITINRTGGGGFCGVFQGTPVLDLDYDEDSGAEIDANFIMTADDQLVEVQATGEAHPFSRATLDAMLNLASAGCSEIFLLQQQAVRATQ